MVEEMVKMTASSSNHCSSESLLDHEQHRRMNFMKKILVIDDNVQCNQMVCRFLTASGYEVSSAPNGVEGLKLFRKEIPDLVVTDLFMPEKDGLETIMELRRTDQKVRILAMSGGSTKMNMIDMLDIAETFGADAIMAKPFQLETFLQKVKELLDE